jgi:D-beta-D-heptose 7-phosphate kinase / D-beta-D-heptose 1-phosphate adenosyltransferase
MQSPLSLFLQSFADLNVIVIGDAILDCYLKGLAERLCPEAPVPVVAVNERDYSAGGGANTAVNVKSLGGQPFFISVVGEDLEGQLLRQLLMAQGVAVDHIITHPQRRTLAKHRVMADSQMLVRFDQGSTDCLDWETEQLLLAQLADLFPICDAVIIADYDYGLLSPNIIQGLAELQAQSPQLMVVDSKKLARYRHVGVTAVKPNYTEAIKLLNGEQALPSRGGWHSGCSDRADRLALQRDVLLDITGAEFAAVTLDAEGALIIQRDQPPQAIAAKPVQCACATGAGDTFVSAFTLALAQGSPVLSAAELATTAAAIAISKAGTTPCTAAELQAFTHQGQGAIHQAGQWLSDPFRGPTAMAKEVG